MAKLTAPLLSFGARGKVADTLVFANWKGREYARSYSIPANPQSAGQTLTRNTFSFLQAVYKLMPPDAVAPWDAYAVGKVLTGRNAFTKFNNGPLREQTDLANLVLSPGALGGLPPASVVATPGDDQLSIAVTAPAGTPTGWTISEAVAAVILDQDPQTDADYQVFAGSDATDPYTIVITGLTAALYRVYGWLVWTRPDGKLAYSPSVATTGTPT